MTVETDMPSEEGSLAEAARQNWERYWAQTIAASKPLLKGGFWNAVGTFVKRTGGRELSYRIVRKELGAFSPDLILEPGCGSGYVSLRLMMRGCRAVFLDSSPSALQAVRRQAENLRLQPCLIRGSVLHLPFKSMSLAASFNVGVLDHFGPECRTQALREMIRVTAISGKVIILTNDARSFVHPRVMKYAQKKGRWSFGFKDAVVSLKSLLMTERRISCREYSRGFLSQFEFLHYLFPSESLGHRFFFWIFYLLFFPFGYLNRWPGQYRVTVIEKGLGNHG